MQKRKAPVSVLLLWVVVVLLCNGSCRFLTAVAHPPLVAGDAATVKPYAGRMMMTMGRGYFYTRGATGRCTAQFWSSGREDWPKMVPQESSLSKIFGTTALEHYEVGLTLLEATQRNDDVDGSAYAQLLKQSTAALLNTYAREGFPFSAWEVKTLVIQALISEDAAASQARLFAVANEACN